MTRTAVREAESPNRPRGLWHTTWRIVKPVGEVLLAILVVLAVVLIPAKTGSTPGVQQQLSYATGRQQNNIQAARASPLAGDTSAIAGELSCLASSPNPGMFTTMTPAEGIDAGRTNSSPCATFLGSYTNPSANKVLAYQSPVPVGGSILDAVTGDPQELFVYCCGSGQQSSFGVNQGHAFALLNAQTLQIEWETTLDNYHASGQWTVLSGLNYEVGPGGTPALIVSYGDQMAKLDPLTGRVLADITLPLASGTNPKDVNYETTVPADGTIITKTQTRPITTGTSATSAPCTAQGFTAMVTCKGKPPDSQVTAVDPDTMKVLSTLTLNQQVGGRDSVGTYNGKTYIYMTGSTNELRVQWNPVTNKLIFDKSWQPTYRLKGQTACSAPVVLGNWVIFNTNAAPAHVSSSIVAVNQGNPADIHRITAIPIGSAKDSFWPSKLSVDPDTDTVYQADTGVGEVAAVHINPSTGVLTHLWGPVKQRTFGFFTIYGPSSQRVVLSTNIDIANPLTVFGVSQAVYGEQFIWRQATTGKEIAHSGYVNGMPQGILPTPGYGGLDYMLQSDGGVVSFEVTK
jgi:hypothetical protein